MVLALVSSNTVMSESYSTSKMLKQSKTKSSRGMAKKSHLLSSIVNKFLLIFRNAWLRADKDERVGSRLLQVKTGPRLL